MLIHHVGRVLYCTHIARELCNRSVLKSDWLKHVVKMDSMREDFVDFSLHVSAFLKKNHVSNLKNVASDMATWISHPLYKLSIIMSVVHLIDLSLLVKRDHLSCMQLV